jgi:hypothetical protein
LNAYYEVNEASLMTSWEKQKYRDSKSIEWLPGVKRDE